MITEDKTFELYGKFPEVGDYRIALVADTSTKHNYYIERFEEDEVFIAKGFLFIDFFYEKKVENKWVKLDQNLNKAFMIYGSYIKTAISFETKEKAETYLEWALNKIEASKKLPKYYFYKND